MTITDSNTTAGVLIQLGPALVALSGVAVGGWVTGRVQRDRGNLDVVRESLGMYVAAVEVFLDTARALRKNLISAAERDRREDLRRAYDQAWTEQRRRGGVARISSPYDVAALALRVDKAAAEYFGKLDDYYQHARGKGSIRIPDEELKLLDNDEAAVWAAEADLGRALRRLAGFPATDRTRWYRQVATALSRGRRRATDRAAARRPTH